MEDIQQRLGSTQSFTGWEFIEQNVYRTLNSTLVFKYFFGGGVYKMMGYSILNGMDLTTGELVNNRYTGKVVETGSLEFLTEFHVECNRTGDSLTKDLIKEGFDKIMRLTPKKRESFKEEWCNIEDLYDEYYLCRQTESEFAMINVSRKNEYKYLTFSNNMEDLLNDASVLKKSAVS